MTQAQAKGSWELPIGANREPATSNRLFSAEGAIHLYSSLPAVLTPADLYLAKRNPQFKRQIEGCNIYLVTTRTRILVDPTGVSFEGPVLRGRFIVARRSGWAHVDFTWSVPDCFRDQVPFDNFGVAESGTHIVLVKGEVQIPIAAHRLVAEAASSLTHEERDLHVLYVGQGIGRSKKRSALERLLDHSTLQRILADVNALHPSNEVLLLLYRFEHQKAFLSTGGDLRLDPRSTADEELAHMHRMTSTKMSRRSQVALSEAALIRYFQPYYNVKLKESRFATGNRIAVLREVLKNDMTGVIVEICSSSAGSRLRSESAVPRELSSLFDTEALTGSRLDSDDMRRAWREQLHQMAHTHYAQFALTTPQERDTFMHGTIWNGGNDRVDLFGS